MGRSWPQVRQGEKEMKKNRVLWMLGLLLIAALALTACTATSGDIQGAIESAATQVGPTVQAAVEELSLIHI